MASVRITQDLKYKITHYVEKDFNELIAEVEKQQAKYENEIKGTLQKEFAEANKRAVNVVSTLIDKAHEMTDEINERELVSAVCNTAANYNYFNVHVNTDDHELKRRCEELEVSLPAHALTVHEVFKNVCKDVGGVSRNNALYLRSEPRWNCGWGDGLIEHKCLNDTELNNTLLEGVLKRVALARSREKAVNFANEHLNAVNTLAQLLKRWPDGRHYIPDAYVEKMEDKIPAEKKVRVEEPELNRDDLDMNKALAAIRMHGEVRRQLK